MRVNRPARDRAGGIRCARAGMASACRLSLARDTRDKRHSLAIHLLRSDVSIESIGANLFADGLSMGVGNFLSIRARESARERQNLPEEEANPARHGLVTFLAFAVAGAIPLLPYIVPNLEFQFLLSSVLALVAQFAVGALRSLVTASRWWVSGLEMLGLGVIVAVVAYGTGAGIAAIVHGAV